MFFAAESGFFAEKIPEFAVKKIYLYSIALGLAKPNFAS
jgi:hypothetical protein